MVKAFTASVVMALGLASATTGSVARQQPPGGGQPPIVYSRGNGGPGFSSHERITLRSDGAVDFETSGPIAFDWTSQNRVGQFETKVDAATYTSLVDAFNRALPKGPHQTIFPSDSGIESISLGTGDGTYLAKAAGDPSPIFDALAARFAPLAAGARQHPVRALELSCAKGADGLACRVQSVGASPVPASFTRGRYWCFDRQHHMLPLSAPVVEGAGRDLAPSQGVDLALKGAACDFHVVMEVGNGVLVSGVVAP